MKHLTDFSLSDWLDEFAEQHPVAASVAYFVVALALLAILAWFLLFSGLNTSADFVYNQF